MKAAELLREARRRSGISQRALAIRAGTKQATISRLESGAEEPTLERLGRLLLVMGFELDLEIGRLEHDVDPADLAATRRLSPADRLRQAASWNRLASQIELAAQRETGR